MRAYPDAYRLTRPLAVRVRRISFNMLAVLLGLDGVSASGGSAMICTGMNAGIGTTRSFSRDANGDDAQRR